MSRLRRSSHTAAQSVLRPHITVPESRESARAGRSLNSRAAMLKTFSLSLLFMLAIGLLIAAYSSIPT